ncbi:hypothetical protein HPHPP26_1591 [Helicobacter pylori Hp P-26]|nr:hypothetical protein HPHPP26_1591 [Helicobacter pylori Hp P-26]
MKLPLFKLSFFKFLNPLFLNSLCFLGGFNKKILFSIFYNQ